MEEKIDKITRLANEYAMNYPINHLYKIDIRNAFENGYRKALKKRNK